MVPSKSVAVKKMEKKLNLKKVENIRCFEYEKWNN